MRKFRFGSTLQGFNVTVNACGRTTVFRTNRHPMRHYGIYVMDG